MSTLRLTVPIRVQPGASRTLVGGRRGQSLLVKVASRAVDGAATAAALAAVADALGLRHRHVTLVHGARSRDKVVAIDVDEDLRPRIVARVEELLGD